MKIVIVGLGRSGTHLVRNIIRKVEIQCGKKIQCNQNHWAPNRIRSFRKDALKIMCIRDMRDIMSSSFFKLLGHTSENDIVEKIKDNTYTDYFNTYHRGKLVIGTPKHEFINAFQKDKRVILNHEFDVIPYYILEQRKLKSDDRFLTKNEWMDINQYIKFYGGIFGISEFMIRKYVIKSIMEGYENWLDVVDYFFSYESFMKNQEDETWKLLHFLQIEKKFIDIEEIIDYVLDYKEREPQHIGMFKGKSSRNLLFNSYQLDIITDISKDFLERYNYE